jgi:hypothetical protein
MSWRPRWWQAWMPGILHFWQLLFFFITALTYTSSSYIIYYVSYINSTPSIPNYLSFWIFKYIYFFINLDVYLCMVRNWGSHIVSTVLFPKLPLFFAKTEKRSPTVLHLKLLFIPNWEKLLRVCIYGRNDPRRILAYKKRWKGVKIILFFYQHFWFKFSVDKRVET